MVRKFSAQNSSTWPGFDFSIVPDDHQEELTVNPFPLWGRGAAEADVVVAVDGVAEDAVAGALADGVVAPRSAALDFAAVFVIARRPFPHIA